MTTAPTTPSRSRGGVLVNGSLLGILTVLLAVVLFTVVAGLVNGSDAARAAGLGGAITLLVLAFGTLTVAVVVRVMPRASMLVALTTYAVQLVVLAAVAAQVLQGRIVESDVERRWFGLCVAWTTLAWMVAQIVAFLRARIPVYDLPEVGAR